MRITWLPMWMLISLGLTTISACGGIRSNIDTIKASRDLRAIVEAVVDYAPRNYRNGSIQEDVSISLYYERIREIDGAGDVLARLAKHPDFRVRAIAIEGIEYLHPVDGDAWIEKFVDDSSQTVRLWAGNALNRIVENRRRQLAEPYGEMVQ